jgi:cytochrome c oxidase subunit 2
VDLAAPSRQRGSIMTDTPDTGLSWLLHLLGPGASTIAGRSDLLFTVMLILCGSVALAITGCLVWFCIRYRKGSSAERSRPPSNARTLELAWMITPLLIFLAIFAWAASTFVDLHRSPVDALPVYVVGKQWMWTLQHRNGRREINELHVPLGQPVRLVMTSQDVIHSFFVPAFRLKQDVVPGRYTSLSFTATRLGDFHLFCSEYCGTEHPLMLGRVVVMAPAAFAQWLGSGPGVPGLAQQGFALFRERGCSGCHAAGSTVHAPLLDGLLGSTVHLQDGRTIVADENYVRDSILAPDKDVVAGFAPVMPSFAGQLSEEQIEALIAYLRSTGETNGASR